MHRCEDIYGLDAVSTNSAMGNTIPLPCTKLNFLLHISIEKAAANISTVFTIHSEGYLENQCSGAGNASPGGVAGVSPLNSNRAATDMAMAVSDAVINPSVPIFLRYELIRDRCRAGNTFLQIQLSLPL